MRLNAENLSTKEQLDEFGQWLTAKLDRIKDTPKFSSEITALCDCILTLAPHLQNFITPETCSINSLCTAVIQASDKIIQRENFLNDENSIAAFYESFFNLLFLTTGATDNNLKNHFLIRLNEDRINPFIPKRGTIKKTINFKLSKIPSTTKSDFIASTLASCFVGSRYPDIVKTEPYFDLYTYLEVFLKEYINPNRG